MIYQCFILRLDCPGPFHKIMTVSNEKIDYILKQRVWQHSFNTAVTSQNNLIRRIFALTFLHACKYIRVIQISVRGLQKLKHEDANLGHADRFKGFEIRI